MYIIGANGLEKVRPMKLQPLTSCYIGASSSPDRVVIIRLDGDRVVYRKPYAERSVRDDVRIIGDLVRRGCETEIKNLVRYAKTEREPIEWVEKEVAHLRALLAGEPVEKVSLADYDRLRIVAKVAPGVDRELFNERPGNDPWYAVETYGNVGGIGEDTYEIEGTRGQSIGITTDKRFEVISIDLVQKFEE